MNILRVRMAAVAAMALLTLSGGLLLLAGCGSTPNPLEHVTGNQGGMLPGMTLPKPPPDKSDGPPKYSGVIQQILPDGRIIANEYLRGQLLSQTLYSSLRLPERAVYFINGSQIGGVSEFGPDGKITKRTYYFVGTNQPERIEEYQDGAKVFRFTNFWPNGNKRILSETDAQTEAGLVNFIEEWYDNGRAKSITQIHVERNARGQALYEEKQGRQTTWSEDGYRTSDFEFDHGRAVHDYLTEKETAKP